MNFREQVFQIVKRIPAGKVASYGQVAALAGSPRAARQVGWMLAGIKPEDNVPWWRVVNRHGYLSIRNDDLSAKLSQKTLLEREAIIVDDKELTVDMSVYQWQISQKI